MRFPSLNQISQQTLTVVRRYPLELLAATIGTYAGVQLTFHHGQNAEHWLLRLMMTASLALPSFLAVTLRGRFRKYSAARRVIEYGIIIALLVLFFFTLNHPPEQKDVMRFFCLAVAAHLLVACAGFLGRGSTAAFWQFNRHLFLRIITAAIFSVVLFVGLAGALAAMDALFDFHVREQWYFRLWIWIAGLFNTIFFLAGVPDDPETLEGERDYPKVLKVFTQFVLVPLVSIYLLILLAYEVKIITLWALPKGWVSHLVIAYGIAGILSVLLVYPIRAMEGNAWIKVFARWFYLLLLPLVALMFVAIGTRINAYGLTEERVFVLVLAIWLAGISIYYLLRPNGDIRVIPASLASLAILLSVGPWSAFSISKYSQQGRLEDMLLKNGILVNGRVTSTNKPLNFEERKRLSSMVEYLLQNHGVSSIKPWFRTDSLRTERWSSYENTNIVLRQVGQQYVSTDETIESDTANRWYSFTSERKAVTITGYNVYLPLMEYYDAIESQDTTGIYIRQYKDRSFAIYRNNARLTPNINPRSFLTALIKKYGYSNAGYQVAPENMQQQLKGAGCEVLIVYSRINGNTDTTKYFDIGYDGIVLVKWE